MKDKSKKKKQATTKKNNNKRKQVVVVHSSKSNTNIYSGCTFIQVAISTMAYIVL